MGPVRRSGRIRTSVAVEAAMSSPASEGARPTAPRESGRATRNSIEIRANTVPDAVTARSERSRQGEMLPALCEVAAADAAASFEDSRSLGAVGAFGVVDVVGLVRATGASG